MHLLPVKRVKHCVVKAGLSCFELVLQAFTSLKRFSGLLGRPNIVALLQDELQAVVHQIDEYLGKLQSDLDQRSQVSQLCPRLLVLTSSDQALCIHNPL